MSKVLPVTTALCQSLLVIFQHPPSLSSSLTKPRFSAGHMTAQNKVFLARHGHVLEFRPLGYKKSWKVILKEGGILSSTLSSCLLVDWKVTEWWELQL